MYNIIIIDNSFQFDGLKAFVTSLNMNRCQNIHILDISCNL